MSKPGSAQASFWRADTGAEAGLGHQHWPALRVQILGVSSWATHTYFPNPRLITQAFTLGYGADGGYLACNALKKKHKGQTLARQTGQARIWQELHQFHSIAQVLTLGDPQAVWWVWGFRASLGGPSDDSF